MPNLCFTSNASSITPREALGAWFEARTMCRRHSRQAHNCKWRTTNAPGRPLSSLLVAALRARSDVEAVDELGSLLRVSQPTDSISLDST